MLFALFLLLAAPAPAAPPPAQNSAEWKTAYLLSRAWEAFSQRRFTEAEQLFKSVLKVAPTNEMALIHLSVITKDRGDLEAAANYLRTAVKANPQSFHAQFHLGCVWLAMKRYEEAAATFNAAIRADPKNLDSRVNLGEAYELFGKGEEARKAYKAALEVDPKSAWAHRQLGYSAYKAKLMPLAVEHLDAAKAGFAKDSNVLLTLGHALSSLGNDAAALDAYTAAAQAAPNQSQPHAFVGTVLEKMGRKAQAEKSYRQAVRVAPNDPLARTLLGNLMRADGRTIQARKEYEVALRSDKNFVWALTQLGSLLFEGGEIVKSSQLLQRALKLAPDNDDIELALGDIEAVRKKYQDAAARYRRVLGRQPQHLAATVKLGYMVQLQGRVQDAKKLYERAVASNPKSAWALIMLGDCERLLHDYGSAEKRFRAALEADPRSTWARRQLGYVLFDAHKPSQAREALLLVEASYPLEATIPLTLGHIARGLKEWTAAMRYYKQAQTLDPKSPLPSMFWGVLENERQRYAQAIEKFDAAIVIDPKLFEAHVLRGDAASELRNRSLAPEESAASQPSSTPSSLPASLAASLPVSKPRDQALADRMYDVAKKSYRKALEIKPDAGWPSRQLGFLEFFKERMEQARPLLIAAGKEFPDDPEIVLARGHIERALKHPQDALVFYDTAVRVAPQDQRGHLFAAIVLRDLGRTDEAYVRSTDAIAIDNTSAWAYYERALTDVELKRSDLALDDALTATKLDWKMRGAWLLAGRMYHERRLFDEAINAYGIAMALQPGDPDVELAYAAALRDRGRFGDLSEAAERVERAIAVRDDSAFAHLVTGHVFTAIAHAEKKGQKVEDIKAVLKGKDYGEPFVDIAERHLRRAVELEPDEPATRVRAAHSLVELGRKVSGREVLEPLLTLGKDLCPQDAWSVSWAIEKNRAELLPSIDTERWKDRKLAEYVAVAYLLAGDLAFAEKKWKDTRLLYACAVAHEPNRPESHLRLGSAHESDGFVRLAEEHFVAARLLVDLALGRASEEEKARLRSRPRESAASQPSSEPTSQPTSLAASAPASQQVIIARGAPPPAPKAPELDEERKKELKVIGSAATDGVGRIRKEGGYPLGKLLRVSGDVSYRSVTQNLELVQRAAAILEHNGGNPGGQPLLALTVPRTLSIRAIASIANPDLRAVPRFELEYRFFRDEAAFLSDQQRIQDRLGHEATVRATGTLPLRVPSFELAYSLSQAVTIASSPSRGEIHSTTALTVRGTLTQLGNASVALGYDASFFNLDPANPGDRRGHSIFSIIRVEPMLARWNLDAGLEYRVDAIWLEPSRGRAWSHALLGNVGKRFGNWYIAEDLRFGFAASDIVPQALPTVFSYLFKTRGGYLFWAHGAAFATFSIAGTGAGPAFDGGRRTFDYVAAGVEGNYRLVWPKVEGITHTGFNFYASYELRAAYNISRIDHFVSGGISFAR